MLHPEAWKLNLCKLYNFSLLKSATSEYGTSISAVKIKRIYPKLLGLLGYWSSGEKIYLKQAGIRKMNIILSIIYISNVFDLFWSAQIQGRQWKIETELS